MMEGSKQCINCVHYSHNVDTDTDGYFSCEWVECAKRPSIGNLKSFPFKNTKCGMFEAKKPPKEGE